MQTDTTWLASVELHLLAAKYEFEVQYLLVRTMVRVTFVGFLFGVLLLKM